jgi:hypothetical protein
MSILDSKAEDARLIVIDEDDDLFSAVLVEYARKLGVSIRRARLLDVARSLSIAIDGDAVVVEPSCSLLLRPIKTPPPMSSPDERFAWSEAFSTVWSAAALTSEPVINRPNEWGWASRVTQSAAVTSQRAGQEDFAAEAYWHSIAPSHEYQYHQDLNDWRQISNSTSAQFGRSRALPAVAGWDQVIVVEDQPFRVTNADIGPRDIENASVGIAKKLGISFASVSWAIPTDQSPAVLTRVNPYPAAFECRPVLTDVCSALMKNLIR